MVEVEVKGWVIGIGSILKISQEAGGVIVGMAKMTGEVVLELSTQREEGKEVSAQDGKGVLSMKDNEVGLWVRFFHSYKIFHLEFDWIDQEEGKGKGDGERFVDIFQFFRDFEDGARMARGILQGTFVETFDIGLVII